MKTKPSSKDDIVELILRDHKSLKDLIPVLKSNDTSYSKKHGAYEKFSKALAIHAQAEEETLYVEMKDDGDLRVEGMEGETEHHMADTLMAEIAETKTDKDLWNAKVKVLAELVEHHIKEEEKEMLKNVKKEFDLETRIEIGKNYLNMLENLKPSGTPMNVKQKSQEMNRVDYV